MRVLTFLRRRSVFLDIGFSQCIENVQRVGKVADRSLTVQTKLVRVPLVPALQL